MMQVGADDGDPDFVYENAPLVEVIAEFRWELVQLASMPGTAIDPLFKAASEKFAAWVSQEGFVQVERLVPLEVPMELVANQPVLRFRKAEGKWPLFQLGPGVFTVNIVPPYEGWQDFRDVLSLGFDALDAAYGLGGDFAKPSQLQLRYLDAFTSSHGMQEYVQFVSEDLNLRLSVPEELAGALQRGNTKFSYMAEARFPLEQVPMSLLSIRASPGQRDREAAAILDLRVTTTEIGRMVGSKAEISDWMDAAHIALRAAFQALTSERLKEAMGPTRQLGKPNA